MELRYLSVALILCAPTFTAVLNDTENARLGGTNEVGRNQWDRTHTVSGLPRQLTVPPH